MQKQYAKALTRLLETSGSDAAALAENLFKHLKARGRMKMLPQILRELKMVEAQNIRNEGVLEVASEGEKAAALKEAKTEGIEKPHTVVNHDLIHGWRARTGSTLIDRSGKQALVTIYKQITN